MFVDGMHCPAKELNLWSDRILFSSKKYGKKSAMNYEIGLALWTKNICWTYGPTPPGVKNDLVVFCEKLREKIPPGKKVVADGIYRPEAGLDGPISCKNEFNPPVSVVMVAVVAAGIQAT